PNADLKVGPSETNVLSASGLTNGVEYACAVSAFDTLDNPGTLSSVVCGTPYPTDDFFTQYLADGGRAGGGICSIGHDPRSYASISAGASVVLLAFVRRRPRKASRLLRAEQAKNPSARGCGV